MGLLEGLGYPRVRDYAGGLAEWIARGGALEPEARPRMHRSREWAGHLIEGLEGASARRLFRLGLLLVIISAALYLLIGLVPGSGLVTGGREVGLGSTGALDALYFSLVTATTLGYGDVTPLGLARLVAVVEAMAGLLLFGAVIAKFLSKRQEALVEELHRLTFENRLERVQANLHLVLADLQTLAELCEAEGADPGRVRTRLESALLVFGGELRAIHDLLHRPQETPPEEALEGLLAGLTAALDELRALLACPAAANARGPALDRSLEKVALLADEICADCVPRQYAPHLREWLDRVHAHAAGLR